MKIAIPDGMAIFIYRLSKTGRSRIIRNLLLLIPGVAADISAHSGLIHHNILEHVLQKLSAVYLIIIGLMLCNSILKAFLDVYNRSDKSRNHPLKGLVQALQAVLFFVGGIVIVATLIDKSPIALLTGLGASAAVLMLVFKDSILGFVAGVQLAQNNMVNIGDWIQTTDGSANGTVEEITLNTIKVRNWDNTITTVPPYTLISTPFKNWRGMQESGGRRVDKMIYLDMTSIRTCSPVMLDKIRKDIPLMADFEKDADTLTNSQLYRIYIERYLKSHPVVAQKLDMIIAQRQAGQFGLPIEVYFFLTDKIWNEFEKIQSDIFDHLIAMASEFGLKLYQLPSSGHLQNAD